MEKMPKWADATLVPLISLLLAAILSALVILAIGEDPVAALKLMVEGALMRSSGWGYTLYYATNFIFTGLAVSVAFHARLFNIGGEGQAMLGGLGVAIACLYVPWPHWTLALLGAAAAALTSGIGIFHTGVERCDEGQGKDQPGKGQEHISQAHQGLVDPASEIAGDGPHREAHRRHHDDDGHNDAKRDAAPVKKAGQNIPAQLIGPQKMVRRGARGLDPQRSWI